jgi:hypothetical protein
MGFALTKSRTASLFITPEHGPSGAEARIEFSGLHAKNSIGLSMSNGIKAIRGLDASGNVTIYKVMNGKPGEKIKIEVTTGEGADEEKMTVYFTITAPYIFK